MKRVLFAVGDTHGCKMMKKAALHNLGCKVNAYETEAMSLLLKKAGYEIVPFNQVADVYIINTCTVTNIADRKSRQMLHRAKKKSPSAIVVAVGCYVQAYKEEVEKDNKIDIFIGNNKKSEIVNILEEYAQNNCNNHVIMDIRHTNMYEEMELETVTEHTRAYIKIQDGCNQFCSYCIIPYARGRVRSRSIANIVNEITGLAGKGFREVVLTGIHLSSFGIDRANDGENLLKAIMEISKIEGIERIRLGSLEPGIITDDFVTVISEIEKICPHFHLSLQSGCDKTLKRMNRRYDTDEYYEKCQLLRKHFNHPAITTDIIVGFPGETEEEFGDTKDFIDKVHFAEMHVFKYSKRAGTKAAKMDNQVKDIDKNARSEQLIRLSESIAEEYKERLIGKSAEVLFEDIETINGTEFYVGYTKEYIKVGVHSDTNLINTINRVNVIDRINKQIMLAHLLNLY